MRFHLDENIADAVADGLRRHHIDVTTTHDAGLSGEMDDAHIEFARLHQRIIFTQDRDFLALAASCVRHHGLVYCHQQTRTIGQMIAFLVLLNECVGESEMPNRIEYVLP